MLNMANKQEMKVSEARIILLINQTHIRDHFISYISTKLEIDYSYTIRILNLMNDKGWLKRGKNPNNPHRTYYHLTVRGAGLIQTAKAVRLTNTTQAKLKKKEDYKDNWSKDRWSNTLRKNNIKDMG